jgi:hypothetical protein
VYNNLLTNLMPCNAGNAGNAAIALTNAGNRLWHNTLAHVGNGGISVDGQSTGTEVTNNIVFQAGGIGYRNAGSGTVASNNLVGPDPLFVSATDYHLQAASPARNTGTASSVTTDLAGTPRPQETVPDVGAYEYLATVGPKVPATPTGLMIVSR